MRLGESNTAQSGHETIKTGVMPTELEELL